MSRSFHQPPVACLSHKFAVAFTTLAVIFGFVSATSAQNEFIKQLIGNDVEEIGPQYKGLEDAVTQFLNRDFAGAKQALDEIALSNPELPPAGVLLGKMFVASKNSVAARDAIEKAIVDAPSDPEAFVIFADTAVQQRRWTDAELLYEKAVVLVENYDANPKRKKNLSIRSINGMAAVAEVRKQWKTAEERLRELTELDAENINALTRLGRALFKQGGDANEKAAYELFHQVYDMDKKRVPRHEINMGRLFEQDGRDASRLYELALERDPESLATQLAVAQWALDTGRPQIAEKCSQAALKLEPNGLQTKQLEGLMSLYNRDYETAEQAYRMANQLAPANYSNINSLAIALVEQSDEVKRRQALEYAQMNLRLLNDRNQQAGRDAAVTMAWVMYRLGNIVQAERTLQEALKAGGIGHDSAYFAAQILSERGRGDAAIQLLNPALESKRLFGARRNAEALLVKLSSK